VRLPRARRDAPVARSACAPSCENASATLPAPPRRASRTSDARFAFSRGGREHRAVLAASRRRSETLPAHGERKLDRNRSTAPLGGAAARLRLRTWKPSGKLLAREKHGRAPPSPAGRDRAATLRRRPHQPAAPRTRLQLSREPERVGQSPVTFACLFREGSCSSARGRRFSYSRCRHQAVLDRENGDDRFGDSRRPAGAVAPWSSSRRVRPEYSHTALSSLASLLFVAVPCRYVVDVRSSSPPSPGPAAMAFSPQAFG